MKVGSQERSYERVLQETPRAVEEDQLEVAETVVLLTEMLRAILEAELQAAMPTAELTAGLQAAELQALPTSEDWSWLMTGDRNRTP